MTASRQASSSNSSSSRVAYAGLLGDVLDVAAQHRAPARVGQVQHGGRERQRRAHLPQRVRGQLVESARRVQRARDAAERPEAGATSGGRRPAQSSGRAGTAILLQHSKIHHTASLEMGRSRLAHARLDSRGPPSDAGGHGGAAAPDRGSRSWGSPRDGAEAVALAERRAPDVALLDLGMPRLNGIEVCAILRERLPRNGVLILTASEREEDLYAALRVGAAGYLVKDMPPSELVEAVLRLAVASRASRPRWPSRMLAELDERAGRGRPARAAHRARARGAVAALRRPAQPRDRRAARDQRGRP